MRLILQPNCHQVTAGIPALPHRLHTHRSTCHESIMQLDITALQPVGMLGHADAGFELACMAMAMAAVWHEAICNAAVQALVASKHCAVPTPKCCAVCSHITLPLCRYDDEWGDYRMVVGDHIGYRFEIMSRLGKGSFGQVAVLPFAALTCTCAMPSHKQQKVLQSAQFCTHTHLEPEIASPYSPMYCFLYSKL